MFLVICLATGTALLLSGIYCASIAIGYSAGGGLRILRRKMASLGMILILAAFSFWFYIFTNYPELPFA